MKQNLKIALPTVMLKFINERTSVTSGYTRS